MRFVNTRKGEIAIQPTSGWPLTLSLTANETELLGIGFAERKKFPQGDDTGYLIFEDPDGCPSWVAPPLQEARRFKTCAEDPPAAGWSRDETMVEFRPGLNVPDPGDCGERPEVLAFNPATGANDLRLPIGPCVGSTTDDFGYGPSPRLPGLVVIADAGLGLIADEPFRYRNLGGFFQSVAYELKDFCGRTSLLVHLNVPAVGPAAPVPGTPCDFVQPGLLSPLILVDRHVSDPSRFVRACGTGENPWIARVDGGPEVCIEGGLDTIPSLLDQHVVTIQAFVVDGRAPETLSDSNQDGVIGPEDFRSMGTRRLSNVARLRVTQVHERSLGGPSPFLPFDFDGDGEAAADCIVPNDGPAGMVNPPR